MAYLIFYGDETQRHRTKRRKYSVHFLMVMVFAICILITGILFPQQMRLFYSSLFPWMQEDVITAFRELCSALQDGKPINDAVTAFCSEVIHLADG